MPRLMSIPNTAASSQRDTFVGRAYELSEFHNSVSYLLGHETPSSPLYPHVFLIHGEGGMGKSALLRQFIRTASAEGLHEDRIVMINLDHMQFATVGSLTQALAQAIRQRHPGFDKCYGQARARREALSSRYRELEKQWSRWEALRGVSDDNLDKLEEAYRQMFTQTEQTRAILGTGHTPPYVVIDNEQALDGLASLRTFRDTRGHTPNSFEELLEHELGKEEAALFLDDRQISQTLAEDLFELAESGPLLLAIDTYERAEQHDDWLRATILANMSDQMLTIIAGRTPLDMQYRRTFGDTFPTLVRSYNLNYHTLELNEIHEYLKLRLNLTGNQLPAALVREVQEISQGIPVALEAVGDQLARTGNLTAYYGMEYTALDRRIFLGTVTERFLRYALDDKHDPPFIRARKLCDRRRIKALAILLRPDVQLLCALWDVSLEEGQRIIRELNDLYSFIFADYGIYTMHDLVREFVRAYSLEKRRSDFDWPMIEGGLRRTIPLIQERIHQIENSANSVDEYYTFPEWRNATLDMLNTLLWLGEQDAACQLLLNRSIEAYYADPSFAEELLALSHEFVHITLFLPWLVRLLQAQNWHDVLPERFMRLIEPHAHAILCYLHAKSKRIESVTQENLEQCKEYIALLEASYALDNNWHPACKALAEAYAALGHYHLYKQQNYTAALTAYNRSVELHPDDPLIFKHRGVAKQNLHDLTGALRDFGWALAFRKDPSVFLNSGRTRRFRGDLAAALVDFEQALMLRPDSPDILYEQAITKAQMRDWAGALDDLDRMLELQPDHLKGYTSRAMVRAEMNDLAGAWADFDRALALRPSDPFTLYSRGVVKQKCGDLIGALGDFQAVHQIDPNSPQPIYGVARIYAVQGHVGEAIGWLKLAIDRKQEYSDKARVDPRFASVRTDPRFIALVSNFHTSSDAASP